MSDEYEDEFDKAFAGFDETPVATPPVAEPPKVDDPAVPPVVPAPEAPKEEPKPNEPAEPKKEDEAPAPGVSAPKAEEDPKPPETPETPPVVPETPQPLTKDDVTSIIRDIQTSERTTYKELDNTTKEVLEAYYPEGLTTDLVDQTTGKVLKTPQDVVEATNGDMSLEQAANWLMNEQYRMDKEVSEIKEKAKGIAETTINFKRDSVAALQKYEPLFKAYPQLEGKVFNQLMKQVKVDKEKGVVLAAPDVMEHYDFYLEPYQQAYEFATKSPATAAPVTPTAPAVPTPGANDRLDEGGDGGASPVNDPTDFAQQVTKELSRGF